MTGYKIITGALRAEATKWDGLAAETGPPRHAAESATLGPTAFLLVDPTGLAPAITWDQPISALLHQQSYEDIRARVAELLGGAVAEFGQIADALIKVATVYEAHERVVEDDLEYIYTA